MGNPLKKIKKSLDKSLDNLKQANFKTIGQSVANDFKKNPLGYISGTSMNPMQSVSNAIGIDRGISDPLNIQRTAGDLHDPLWMGLRPDKMLDEEAEEPTPEAPSKPDLLFRRRANRGGGGFRSLMVPLSGKSKTQIGLGIPQ